MAGKRPFEQYAANDGREPRLTDAAFNANDRSEVAVASGRVRFPKADIVCVIETVGAGYSTEGRVNLNCAQIYHQLLC